MSDVKKTIKINPEIFNIGTRKNKDKKKQHHHETQALISPNILKNKLLKRIKEHKISENTERKNDDSSSTHSNSNYSSNSNSNSNSLYSDEFKDSIEYLQSLSKQKKNEEDNARRKQQLLNKTIRNNSNVLYPHVELDLPEELQPVSIVPFIDNTSSINIIPSINYKVDNAVPYGCLKGGYKPTFRDLNKTRKVYEVNNPSETLNVSSLNLEREQILNALKQKVRSREGFGLQNNSSLTVPNNVNSMHPNSLDIIPSEPSISSSIPISTLNIPTSTTTIQYIPNTIPNNPTPIPNNPTPIPNNPTPIPINTPTNTSENVSNNSFEKQLIKKTCKRKYTLGKSKVNRSVGILIKDNKTRKNIINAQKELKHHSISDIKKYLHKHNLIKSGSNAPNDVIRKLYESCMLAGEITNLNKDTLLHNFAKEPN